jgi:hypothetical protein
LLEVVRVLLLPCWPPAVAADGVLVLVSVVLVLLQEDQNAGQHCRDMMQR